VVDYDRVGRSRHKGKRSSGLSRRKTLVSLVGGVNSVQSDVALVGEVRNGLGSKKSRDWDDCRCLQMFSKRVYLACYGRAQ